MASALLETQSPTNLVGEITESLPTSPPRSFRIAQIGHVPSVGRDGELHFPSVMSDRVIALDRSIEPDGRVIYTQKEDDVPSEADTHFKKLPPLQKLKSPVPLVGSLEEITATSVDGITDVVPWPYGVDKSVCGWAETDTAKLNYYGVDKSVCGWAETDTAKLNYYGVDKSVCGVVETDTAKLNYYGVDFEFVASGNNKYSGVDQNADFVRMATGAWAKPDFVGIDMDHIPKEDDNVPGCRKFAFGKFAGKFKWLTMGGALANELVERVGVGFWSSSNYTNFAGPSWAMPFVEGAKIAGFAATVGGYGMSDYKPQLSTAMIKAGAIATASGIIASLAWPLPAPVAWTVGPAAWLIVAASVAFK